MGMIIAVDIKVYSAMYINSKCKFGFSSAELPANYIQPFSGEFTEEDEHEDPNLETCVRRPFIELWKIIYGEEPSNDILVEACTSYDMGHFLDKDYVFIFFQDTFYHKDMKTYIHEIM